MSAGIEHYEMYFPDGHNPPDDILDRFLDVARHTDGAVALPHPLTRVCPPSPHLRMDTGLG